MHINGCEVRKQSEARHHDRPWNSTHSGLRSILSSSSAYRYSWLLHVLTITNNRRNAANVLRTNGRSGFVPVLLCFFACDAAFHGISTTV